MGLTREQIETIKAVQERGYLDSPDFDLDRARADISILLDSIASMSFDKRELLEGLRAASALIDKYEDIT